MKPKESKTYWEKGKLQRHCFLVGELRHGEYKYYSAYGKGRLAIHTFYVHGLKHGPYEFYQADVELADRVFCIHGKNILDFPFLPDKPARKKNNQKRTRYQTLEM